MSGLNTVPDNINFAKEEAKVIEKWRTEKTFEKQLQESKDRPRYTFYDGPPFATGLPHYGHLLAGTIKDVITRWAAQDGFYVERRFGWDCHGLPVEFEVDKALGIKGPADIMAMGIDKYNAECRSIVMRYAGEWEAAVERMGRWIDFKNDYKTLYPWFMESVWWAFSELVKKGLVYRGVKVMPYSTSCSTPLSNFEAGQNYKDVVDPAVHVGFRLDENPNRWMVAWTTTPWTLPSNLALAVHPDLEYVVAKDKTTGVEYVVLECRISELKNENLEIVEKVKGSAFVGKHYQPLFPYFAHLKEERKAFRVLSGTFITTDQGTGVVHQAPYFGEVDFQCCLEHGVISKDMKPICPVDETGKYTSEVTDYVGVYVKDADKAIMKRLKESGHLVRQGECKHSYPFCWRSDTPLLYKAVPSWFIRVESLVPRLLASNEQTYWVPQFVKDKRFGNWLRDARDWAVSRNRFWGTPINMWVSDDLEEMVCPGSIAELEKLSGRKITDIHRESVDHITIPSKTGRGVLKRVSEVFDCWFESGSMPYAQNHYPFENKKAFEDNFPADFIAEGIDQTRGWFYTLIVLSTALFNKPPFKNLICNGLVLASDGMKMSKRLKNYPDPMEVVNKYGADALRLYLINSPVVRGENLRFREEGVRDVLKDVFLPWFNAYRFFVQNVQLYEHQTGETFSLTEQKLENVMDRWIESFTSSLVKFVRKEMSEYHLYAVVTPLTRFFDTLTNCYIRLNRRRIKGDEGETDRLHSLSALGLVLITVNRLMAPFTPFFCEHVWTNLAKIAGSTSSSIHLERLPQPNADLIDEDVERRVSAMRETIDLVRVIRERNKRPIKTPLRTVVVINRNQQFLADLESLQQYLLSETNVQKLVVSQEKEKYGITLKAEPNFKLLGARLKGDQKKVADYLKNKATEEELEKFLVDGKLTVLGFELTSEEVAVTYASKAGAGCEGFESASNASTIVMLDCNLNEELEKEGLVREVVNRVQRLRKEAKLVSTDEAEVYIEFPAKEGKIRVLVESEKTRLEAATGTPIHMGALPQGKKASLSSETDVKEEKIKLHLVCAISVSSASGVTVVAGKKKTTVRVETSEGRKITYNEFLYEVRSAFDHWTGTMKLKLSNGEVMKYTTDIPALSGSTLTVV
ncbi:hypothetical protein PFISCL1PPCAC_15106 [Pristionchus fissidentatus]|uniref:Isoleucine--tRNA ligase, cytoplasmic n=1 Tax=Pristionchus fissidentatus TaxID=1538716 RepID=A0AAV5VW66_9BILA|nr:hypothetical protein PFISCL1PPCAC_15106 [Pristionchus fissidentatus]